MGEPCAMTIMDSVLKGGLSCVALWAGDALTRAPGPGSFIEKLRDA